MSFTRGQQPELRQYLALAWEAHCAHEGLQPAARCAKSKRCGECAYCRWYEDVLEGATGHRSTTECDAGRDYDFFMRDLEAIHGLSIRWQMKAFRGDAKRILHDVQALCGGTHEVAEEYLQRIGAKALKLDRLPELHRLTKEQLGTIRIAVKQHVTRGQVAEADRDPQISRKTRREKPQQVNAWRDGMERKLQTHADAGDEAAAEPQEVQEVPEDRVPF